MTMNDMPARAEYKALVDRYIAAWNGQAPGASPGQPGPSYQLALAELFTEDVRYCDPLAVAVGHVELASYIGNTMRQFPGMTFSAGDVDGHHDQVRFTWSLGRPGQSPAVTGLDVALLRGARFAAVHGFFD